MTAQVIDRPVQTRSTTAKPVSFRRVLHAEWVKLWSLRSTYWSAGATVAAMVLVAVMLAVTTRVDQQAAQAGLDGTMAIGMGYTFAQVVVAVLGVLTITGEYSTGMIRSTLAAVPTRFPALAAKAILIAVVGFALGVVGVTGAYLASYPLLGSNGAADLADPNVQRIVGEGACTWPPWACWGWVSARSCGTRLVPSRWSWASSSCSPPCGSS